MRPDGAEDESEGSGKNRRKNATNGKGIVCNSCINQTRKVRAVHSAGQSERQAIILPLACSKYTTRQTDCQGSGPGSVNFTIILALAAVREARRSPASTAQFAPLPAPRSAQKPRDSVRAAPGQERAKQFLLMRGEARDKKSAARPVPAPRSVCGHRAGAVRPRPARARSAAGTTWRQARRHRRAHRIVCSTTQARQRRFPAASAAGNMPAHLRAQARNTGKGASRRAAEETTPILSPCHLHL